jgi:carbon starvation protein
VLILPAVAVFQTINGMPAWRAVWPLFGSTNQLMAAMALLTFLVFLKNKKLTYGFVIPAVIIMVVMPLLALILMVADHGPASLLGGIASVMFILGGFVTFMSIRFVVTQKS